MISIKKESGKLTVNFSSTMFFEEIMKCPAEKRKEFIEHIEKTDSEWLFRFCTENFGSKIFYFEN